VYAIAPHIQIRSPRSIALLSCGLLLFLLFAGLYFNPLTHANIAFAVRIDPDMRALRDTDTSLTALFYFAGLGLSLGLARLAILRRFRGGQAMLMTWPGTLIGSIAGSYLGLRLLNPALPCMLEICHSTFVLNYGLPTLGLGLLLASFYSFQGQESPKPDSLPSCASKGGLILLLLLGLVLLALGLSHGFVLSGTC
jgi:hypothetical protein